MYTIYAITNDKRFDISKVINEPSWGDDVETLGMDYTFKIINRVLYSNDFTVNEGDKIVVINAITGKEIFSGIIVTIDIEEHTSSVTALDYAFYLNQSKVIVQFNRISVKDAITQLCNKFGVPIYKIEEIKTSVNKIYINQTVAEIIVDLLDQATKEQNVKYRFEMESGKLHIAKYSDLIVEGNIKLATNLGAIKLNQTISALTKSRSIMEMKNSIIAANESKILATLTDDLSIKKFGLLQQIVAIDDKNEAQARNIVSNLLKELNKVPEKITVEALGDDTIRSGRIIPLQDSNFALDGNYLIKNCRHSFANNNHKVSMSLELI